MQLADQIFTSKYKNTLNYNSETPFVLEKEIDGKLVAVKKLEQVLRTAGSVSYLSLPQKSHTIRLRRMGQQETKQIMIKFGYALFDTVVFLRVLICLVQYLLDNVLPFARSIF